MASVIAHRVSAQNRRLALFSVPYISFSTKCLLGPPWEQIIQRHKPNRPPVHAGVEMGVFMYGTIPTPLSGFSLSLTVTYISRTNIPRDTEHSTFAEFYILKKTI